MVNTVSYPRRSVEVSTDDNAQGKPLAYLSAFSYNCNSELQGTEENTGGVSADV